MKRSMAGGVQMGPCQVIAGSQCGFLLADGASVLDALSEVQEPIDVEWAFCLLVLVTYVSMFYNIYRQYINPKYTMGRSASHIATVDPIRTFKVRRGLMACHVKDQENYYGVVYKYLTKEKS
ncbi:hypothetical protein VN97_g8921 [Penicillium thymicola]|uniref:Uncharacterized protein n=1 Tax=Penicillium thymicola TaxID=293382 RepID=A0AAI9TDA7_PENTH|nr:hypothetical protein VN97_g8921 [Penicillium thymicola]